MKTIKRILNLAIALVLVAALLAGCGTVQTAIPLQAAVLRQEVAVPAEKAVGGVLCLKINPEIALHYDETGTVTKLEGRNADGMRILEAYTGYEGKETSQVLQELVNLIGEAGYFVDEAEGESRKIVLELEPGSNVPHDTFLESMAAHVKKAVENKSWMGKTDYEYDEPAPAVPAEPTTPVSTVPSGLCSVCADDDCDDGEYCDDADEKAENLREQENRKNGIRCEICGDYDCDDGKYCDDADEKAENLREQENRKNGIRCEICGDYDCDDGKYCDDWDDRHDDDDDDDDD